jgi:hypothetical protein
MKAPFALLYALNLIKKNPIKMIALALAIIIAPFLNGLKDIRNSDRIDYQYEKGGQLFYVTQGISNNKICYDIKSFEKKPEIKNGYLITYSYNDANIFIWIAFVIACAFPIIGMFISDDDANYTLGSVFESTISYYITCELEEETHYYFYEDRFLGKSDRPIHKEYSHIARAFGITSMTKLRSFPKWKTKMQKRTSKLEEIGV